MSLCKMTEHLSILEEKKYMNYTLIVLLLGFIFLRLSSKSTLILIVLVFFFAEIEKLVMINWFFN